MIFMASIVWPLIYIFVILCGNSWDIESNLGPKSLNITSHFPCGMCDADVGWEDPGVGCDTCYIWNHIDCQCLSSTMYSILNKSSGRNIVWECLKCETQKFSKSPIDTTAFLETHNRFDSLSSLSILRVQYQLTAVSSPIVQEPKEAKGKKTKAALNHPL